MYFKNIVLSERSQTKKVHTVWLYLYEILEKEKLIHKKPFGDYLGWEMWRSCLLTAGSVKELLG